MLSFLNEYAALINIALFVAIVGFLFNLQKMSREALTDKFEMQLEALRGKIAALESHERIAQSNREAANNLLLQQLSFYKSLAEMPEERKMIALKQEYQHRITELEKLLAEKTQEGQELVAGIERAIQDANEKIKSRSITQNAASGLLDRVIGLTYNLLK